MFAEWDVDDDLTLNEEEFFNENYFDRWDLDDNDELTFGEWM